MWDIEDDGRKLISKLQELGALPNEIACPHGHGPMNLVKDEGSFWWKCEDYFEKPKEKIKRVRCRFKQSVRKDTFFHNSKLSISQICKFVNLWVDNASLKLIGKQCDIGGSASLTDWASFSREVLFDSLVINKGKIGGPGKTVEIEESKFGKRKYNRGHRVEGQWVFGGIERETGQCFMVPVGRRDRNTLLPIIKEWILPGTTIMSDCWKAYDCLKDEGYQHLKVNHSLTFVDPETGACTNKIEASWNAAKRTIAASGRRKSFYPGYLAKYMFQKRCLINNLDPFKEFMKAAGKLYDPINPAAIVPNSDDDSDDDFTDTE